MIYSELGEMFNKAPGFWPVLIHGVFIKRLCRTYVFLCGPWLLVPTRVLHGSNFANPHPPVHAILKTALELFSDSISSTKYILQLS